MVRRPRADTMQPRSTASDSATQRHRPKTLTVFAAAFAAGAVLAYGVDRVVDVHVVQVEPQVESEPIFVALRSLPQGAPITVWDVALKDWPKAMLPTTALKADSSFEGMVLRHPIREGQPLLSVQLVRDGATLPTMTVATLPPATAPSTAPTAVPQPAAATASPAGPVEQFVPATPAEQSSATAVAEPAARGTEVSRVEAGPAAVNPGATPVAAPEVTAVADADIDADIPADVAATESKTDGVDAADEPPHASAAHAPQAVATAETRPSDATPTADGPALVAIGRLFAASTEAAAAAEPTLAVAEPAATPADVAPLAAPVPNSPTTDIERSLSAFSRRASQPDAPTESVLDRTAVEPPPARSTSTPRYHLVVPERIALAADSSFVQRPEPPSTPTTPPAGAAPQQQATNAVSNSNTHKQATTAATNPNVRPQGSAPAMRRPPMTARQQVGKPAAARQAAAKPGASKQAGASPNGRPVPKSAAAPTPGKTATPASRGLGAWFPQFSGGSWQR